MSPTTIPAPLTQPPPLIPEGLMTEGFHWGTFILANRYKSLHSICSLNTPYSQWQRRLLINLSLSKEGFCQNEI